MECFNWPEWAENFVRDNHKKLSLTDIARAISRIAGREVTYTAVRRKIGVLRIADKKKKRGYKSEFKKGEEDFDIAD